MLWLENQILCFTGRILCSLFTCPKTVLHENISEFEWWSNSRLWCDALRLSVEQLREQNGGEEGYTSGVYPFTGLDYWTGLLDWTTRLDYWTHPFAIKGHPPRVWDMPPVVVLCTIKLFPAIRFAGYPSPATRKSSWKCSKGCHIHIG